MRYLITYSYDRGSGNCVVALPRPISSEEDIDTISQKIAATNGFVDVVITRHTPLPEAAD